MLKKPTFIIQPPKPKRELDPAKVELFAAGASMANNDSAIQATQPMPSTQHQPTIIDALPATPIASPTTPVRENLLSSNQFRTNFILRFLPEQHERINQVLEHSTYKSKQQMGEALLMKAIEDLAHKLGL